MLQAVAISLITLALAIGLHYRDDASQLNGGYSGSFTEEPCGDSVARPGNAWSSWVYAFLAIYLVSRPTARPLARAAEMPVLVWFSCVSYGYHTTTARWTGAQDLWCVTYLCVS